MNSVRFAIFLCALTAAPALARAPWDGVWILKTDRFGTNEYSTLSIAESGGALTGDWDGDAVRGTVSSNGFTFEARTKNGESFQFEGSLRDGMLQGAATYPDSNDPDRTLQYIFRARRVPDRPSDMPVTHKFVPQDYSNLFSADRAPVLTIWPGDTVETSTVDSGGVDKDGVTRALFGNPQTGPFFVAGAEPGDTLAIHILRVTPNRDWADSLDMIVRRARSESVGAQAGDLGKPVRWHLDRSAGFATPEGASGALSGYRVPIRPMLGGLALAGGFGWAPMSTGDTGRSGGNMDYPEVRAGSIVYLPVQQPGALLYLGDGHAAQGDGETSQYALETSLDVVFRVELIKKRPIPGLRVENDTAIMVLGQAGSLDEALKAASSGMIRWLESDYGMSLSQAAQVMGTAVQFSIPNLAGANVGVAARIEKAILPPRIAG